MNQLKKIFFSKFFWTVIAIIIQVLALAFLITYLGIFSFSVTLYSFFAAILAFIIFCRDDSPEYRMSWMLVVLIIPVLGGLLYLLFGNKRQSEKERMIKMNYQKLINDRWDDVTGVALPISSLEDTENRNLAKYLNVYTNAKLYSDSSVTYYPQSDDVFLPFLNELKNAKKFIFLEFFIYEKGIFLDRMLEILRQKISESVEVYLMYDDIGSAFTLPANFVSKLSLMGIKAVCFNPIKPRVNQRLNYRDHRKMCIIDGNTVISGGLNIADEYINRKIRFGHWKDNAFVIHGAGVWNYTLMFMQLWNFSCPVNYVFHNYYKYAPVAPFPKDKIYIQSYGDGPFAEDRVAENAYLALINSSKDFIWISTPYLILDSAMQNALIFAAKRSVDVRIITPAVPDKKLVFEVTRSNYYSLVENGIKIYEYLPGFIHSKMIVCDDKRAILGTTNMDFRSFFLHFECATVLYENSVINEIKNDFLNTFEYCEQVPVDYRKSVSRIRRIFRGFIKAVAPML